MSVPIESHALRVRRTGRYFRLGDPRSAEEVWYALHGYGQSARQFLEQFAPLVTPRRAWIAPEGLSRFYVRGTTGRVGASWMTREDREHEIDDYVAFLDAVHAEQQLAPDVRVGILGFSQGVPTAARWAVLGAAAPARLVLWAGGFPEDLAAERVRAALADVAVTLALGDDDPEREVLAGETARLAALGLEPAQATFAGGHEVHLATLAACLEGP